MTSSPLSTKKNRTDPVTNRDIIKKFPDSANQTQPIIVNQKSTTESTNETINLQDFINEIPGSDIVKYADTLYQTENIDLSWATDQELFIDSYFKNTEELKNFIPESIECKKTLCKISIPVTNNNEQFTTSIQIANALQQDKNIISTHAIFDSTPNKLHIFIPKNDSEFFNSN